LRINILIVGGLIVAVSILFLYSVIAASIFGFILGGLNIIIGFLIPKASRVSVPDDGQGPLKLLLDKGVIRTSIYTVAFSEKKLVLRKLGSANLTVVTALLLALLGAALAGYFGIVVGGVTAFSLQEFVTQRRRDRISKGNPLEPSGSGDLEYSYDEIEQIRMLRNRLQINLKDRVVRIAISRRYPRIMGPVLEKIIPAKIQSDALPSGRVP
jgi:hypothetical protein